MERLGSKLAELVSAASGYADDVMDLTRGRFKDSPDADRIGLKLVELETYLKHALFLVDQCREELDD